MCLTYTCRFLFLFGCFLVQTVEGLQCWKCERATNVKLCSNIGRMVRCLTSQNSCVTVVRRYGDESFMWKGCKQTVACQNDQNQNREKVHPYQNQCNSHLNSSVCTCCCHSNLCNAKEACHVQSDAPSGSFARLRASELPQKCPNVNRLNNGKVECTSSNNVGSICNFTCTSDGFTIQPTPEATTSECLANGEWSQPKRCCARSCPPYAPMDLVVLLHIKSHRTWLRVLTTFTRNVLRTYKLGYDALRLARITFSRVPHLDQAILLNDTNNMAASTFFELAQTQKYRQADDGLVNIGAALTYALQIIKVEKQDPNRPLQAVVVLTDSKSDDDVLGPAEALRNEGVLTFAQFYQDSSSVNYDIQELLQIAGADQRVMVINKNDNKIPDRQDFDIFRYVCADICKMYEWNIID